MRKGSTGNKYKKRRKMSYVNNGIITTRIPEETLDEFLENNPEYSRGMKKEGRVIVTDGITNRYLTPSNYEDFLSLNPDYHIGHVGFNGRIAVNNGDKEKHIFEDEIDKYLLSGYMLGPLPMVWINNGVIESRIRRGSDPPKGWHYGMLYLRKSFSNKGLNFRWINNGVQKKMVRCDKTGNLLEELPEGWILGRITEEELRLRSEDLRTRSRTSRRISSTSLQLFDLISEGSSVDLIYGRSEHKIDSGLLYDDLVSSYRFLDLYCESHRKAIEFHGDYWHPRSSNLLEDNRSYLSVSSDYNKFKAIKRNNIDVYYVWESDFLNNPRDVASNCIEFLEDDNNHGIVSIDDWFISNKVSGISQGVVHDLMEVDDIDYYEYNQMRRDLWMKSQGKVG